VSDERVDLTALAAEAAEELEGCRAEPSSGGAEGATYSRGGVEFAAHARDVLRLRLPPDIAEVARRMPDVRAGSEGWVELRPRPGDPHVADRARAWFVTAWRHAGGGRERRQGD
jgi:hypothetical protein